MKSNYNSWNLPARAVTPISTCYELLHGALVDGCTFGIQLLRYRRGRVQTKLAAVAGTVGDRGSAHGRSAADLERSEQCNVESQNPRRWLSDPHRLGRSYFYSNCNSDGQEIRGKSWNDDCQCEADRWCAECWAWARVGTSAWRRV